MGSMAISNPLLSPSIIFLLICSLPFACSWEVFNGKGGNTSTSIPVIKNCSAQYPSQTQFCYQILDCIIENIEPAITQRWSAGASILAFIPTVLCLTSNSIEEITILAEDSPFLAILLCVSSLTTFSGRFELKTHKDARNRRESLEVSAQRLWDRVEDAVYRNGTVTKPWWQNQYLHTFGFGAMLLGLSAGIWYYLLDVMKYGVIVFACKIKFNIGLWAAATQALGIVNVLCRRQMFDSRKIQYPLPRPSKFYSGIFDISRMASLVATSIPMQSLEQLNPGSVTGIKLETTLHLDHLRDVAIVLRSERHTRTRWTLQLMTAVLSYGLLTYGTVLFASTTLYVASDAIRFMVTVAFSAGFGRVVVSLLGSTSASGKRMILVDVPAEQLVELSDVVRETVERIAA